MSNKPILWWLFISLIDLIRETAPKERSDAHSYYWLWRSLSGTRKYHPVESKLKPMNENLNGAIYFNSTLCPVLKCHMLQAYAAG